MAWARRGGQANQVGGVESRNEWLTVVGVAVSTRYRELAIPRPTLYIPAEQFGITAGRLAIRTAAPVEFVAGVLGEAVKAADPAVNDPATLLSAAVVLVAAALLASCLLARRATKVDPIVVLRAE